MPLRSSRDLDLEVYGRDSARIIMIGTLTALQWFIYDSVKVYFRLPRPPTPEMPESLKKKLGYTQYINESKYGLNLRVDQCLRKMQLDER